MKILKYILFILFPVLASGKSDLSEDILMKFSHKNFFNLDQMADKADGIYVVKKDIPFSTIRKKSLDTTGKYPPHLSRIYHFEITRVLKDSLHLSDSSISVSDPYRDLSYTAYCLYYSRGMVMEPLVSFYRPSISMDKSDSLIIFVSRDKEKGSKFASNSFSFTVFNGFESAKLADSVATILQRLGRPVKSMQEIMMAKEKLNAEYRSTTKTRSK